MTKTPAPGRPGSKGNIYKHGWKQAAEPVVMATTRDPGLMSASDAKLAEYAQTFEALLAANDLSPGMRKAVEAQLLALRTEATARVPAPAPEAQEDPTEARDEPTPPEPVTHGGAEGPVVTAHYANITGE